MPKDDIEGVLLQIMPADAFKENRRISEQCISFVKGKAAPSQVWGVSEGSRNLRLPDFLTTAQNGGKVVSPKYRPHLPPGNTPGTHFC
jgi:hypothetical protein